MMKWLPIPQDFKGQLRDALRVSHALERLHRLAFLSQHQLGYLETIQLERALNDLKLDSAPGFLSVRLAILGSSTVEHLVSGIRIGGLRRGLLIDVHLGGYGQYRQDLLNPSSALHSFAPQFVLFSLSAREAIAGIALTATRETVDEVIRRYIDELRSLWRKACETFNATVVQQTFLDVTDPLFGSFDRQVPAVPSQLIARLNDQVSDAAVRENILVLDIARASERTGRDAWFDRSRWFQAKQEIAPQAALVYGDLLARLVAAQRGLSKKCLVLDLDNTLWHGVIGDDGLQGIVLGEGSAVGEAHLSFQHYARQLLERGIILAVCSKNDQAVAEEVFLKHPETVLKRADFAAFVANWGDKAENLRAIANQLNLGIDSLVFVDDNPVERARIRQALPMVAVPELPDDAADYARCLAEAGYFESVSFTSDDLQRGSQYAANIARENLRGSAESLDDFLRALDMTIEYGPFSAVDLSRVTQLINKTNQFNPTTRRYTIDEIAQLSATRQQLTLQFRLLDRFGDNGLVSAMILLPDPEQPDELLIDTWVMSCRVFGRQLEFEAMNVAVELARRRGVRSFRGQYIPTAKNRPVSELFPSLGFAPVQALSSDGVTKWSMKLSDYVPKETWIARSES